MLVYDHYFFNFPFKFVNARTGNALQYLIHFIASFYIPISSAIFLSLF